MTSLARFVAQRLALLLLTLFAVSVLIFSITQLLPGDVATMILGMQATPQDLATIRAQLGLDQPAIVQFGRWLGGVLQGDLGVSTRFQRPVVEILGPPLKNSFVLASAINAATSAPQSAVLPSALRRRTRSVARVGNPVAPVFSIRKVRRHSFTSRNPPDANREPSGLNASALTTSRCAPAGALEAPAAGSERRPRCRPDGRR